MKGVLETLVSKPHWSLVVRISSLFGSARAESTIIETATVIAVVVIFIQRQSWMETALCSVRGLLDKPVVQPHVIRQQKYSPGSQLASVPAIVELPGIGVPMVEMAVLHREHLAVGPVTPLPASVGVFEVVRPPRPEGHDIQPIDRKSTRLNSSHLGISYAVFC